MKTSNYTGAKQSHWRDSKLLLHVKIFIGLDSPSECLVHVLVEIDRVHHIHRHEDDEKENPNLHKAYLCYFLIWNPWFGALWRHTVSVEVSFYRLTVFFSLLLHRSRESWPQVVLQTVLSAEELRECIEWKGTAFMHHRMLVNNL